MKSRRVGLDAKRQIDSFQANKSRHLLRRAPAVLPGPEQIPAECSCAPREEQTTDRRMDWRGLL
jgi:hypothetical protein